MKAVKQLLVALTLVVSMQVCAQQYNQAGASPALFPELVFTEIKGAPKLSMPIWIQGTEHVVSGKGMGWASPLLYDADGDGLDDLLVGEFASGLGTTAGSGSFLMVHTNIGTRAKPQYSGIAKPLYHAFGKGSGTPLSIFTWCCMAFTPRLADMDGDGKADMVTGQYDPGDITWFKKFPNGFGRGELIEQAGQNSRQKFASNIPALKEDTSHWGYWTYSAASFLDMHGNGLNDMIVGGTLLRAAKNIGSKEKPKFGVREILKDIHGNYLNVWNKKELTDKKIKLYDSLGIQGTCMVPYTVDWDNDGITDLLVTSSYVNEGAFVISFFKGVKKGKTIAFHPGVPLFAAKNGGKALPGSHPNICVGDWNNDGINDLIIGTTVTTMRGKYDAKLSWSWEQDAGTYKLNPAYMKEEHKDLIYEEMRKADSTLHAKGFTIQQAKDEGWAIPEDIYKRSFGPFGMERLAHEGYVYVMLGTK